MLYESYRWREPDEDVEKMVHIENKVVDVVPKWVQFIHVGSKRKFD